jgi:hypothetical protein
MNLEVRILKELRSHFAEVRIVKGLQERRGYSRELKGDGFEEQEERASRKAAEEEWTWHQPPFLLRESETIIPYRYALSSDN